MESIEVLFHGELWFMTVKCGGVDYLVPMHRSTQSAHLLTIYNGKSFTVLFFVGLYVRLPSFGCSLLHSKIQNRNWSYLPLHSKFSMLSFQSSIRTFFLHESKKGSRRCHLVLPQTANPRTLLCTFFLIEPNHSMGHGAQWEES